MENVVKANVEILARLFSEGHITFEEMITLTKAVIVEKIVYVPTPVAQLVYPSPVYPGYPEPYPNYPQPQWPHPDISPDHWWCTTEVENEYTKWRNKDDYQIY